MIFYVLVENQSKTNPGLPWFKNRKWLLMIGLTALAVALVLASVAAYLIINQKLLSHGKSKYRKLLLASFEQLYATPFFAQIRLFNTPAQNLHLYKTFFLPNVF
jgi:hypothetical protein